ncbi:MAG TPA: hypothetical protein VGH37_08800 [Candidatus Acidoferrum sp.]
MSARTSTPVYTDFATSATLRALGPIREKLFVVEAWLRTLRQQGIFEERAVAFSPVPGDPGKQIVPVVALTKSSVS